MIECRTGVTRFDLLLLFLMFSSVAFCSFFPLSKMKAKWHRSTGNSFIKSQSHSFVVFFVTKLALYRFAILCLLLCLHLYLMPRAASFAASVFCFFCTKYDSLTICLSISRVQSMPTRERISYKYFKLPLFCLMPCLVRHLIARQLRYLIASKIYFSSLQCTFIRYFWMILFLWQFFTLKKAQFFMSLKKLYNKIYFKFTLDNFCLKHSTILSLLIT